MATFGNLRGWRRSAATAAVLLFAGAGCVAARPSAAPLVSPGGQAETAAPFAGTSAVPTMPTASPAPVYDLSNVPPAPAQWQGIHWVQVPATPLTAMPSPDPGASVQTIDTEFNIAGWSRGFVGFSLQSVTPWNGQAVATVATTYSSDGVHWHDGTVLRQPISIDNLQVIGLFEGPSGLLAVGASGACGDSWIEALWTSPDGISWRKVDTGKAFGQSVIENVSGGSSGFVATASDGSAVWTSSDGQGWQPVGLDLPAFARSRIDGGTAFSGGYALAGSTEDTGAQSCGAYTLDPSAPPTPVPPMRSPVVWWSPDGATWTMAELPGATPAYYVRMEICRANDHELVAYESYNGAAGSGSTVWISNDGRTWKVPAASGLNPHLLTDGRHGIVVNDSQNPGVAEAPSSNVSFSLVTDDGGLVSLAQDGNRPPYYFQEQWAVGPTGILWTDGIRLWIGLPSAA